MKKEGFIFFIKDELGSVWGMAPTKIQARRQISWFLPKNIKYIIEPYFISSYIINNF